MTRVTFERLTLIVGIHLQETNRLVRIRTPLDVCLQMVVWILATGDSFRSTGAHFGKCRSVVHHHYRYIIECLRELAPRFIKWPSPAERDVIRVDFERRYGYPGVIGVIDGTHVEITSPSLQPQRYVNRHHKFSITCQAVCDNRLLYRDVYVGQPGSVGDARTFARSPLSNHLLRREDLMGDDEHLLGDGAYTLTRSVLTPYVDDGHLTVRQRRHNLVLSRCRASIERSFARWKGKWRRLKRFEVKVMDYAIDHILSCFVVHNFIILEGQEPQGLFGDYVFDQEVPQQVLMDQARNDGALKREFIAQLLHPAPDLEE